MDVSTHEVQKQPPLKTSLKKIRRVSFFVNEEIDCESEKLEPQLQDVQNMKYRDSVSPLTDVTSGTSSTSKNEVDLGENAEVSTTIYQ